MTNPNNNRKRRSVHRLSRQCECGRDIPIMFLTRRPKVEVVVVPVHEVLKALSMAFNPFVVFKKKKRDK